MNGTPIERITPLDPASPRGREFARDLTELLGEFAHAVAERKRDAQRHADAERGAA